MVKAPSARCLLVFVLARCDLFSKCWTKPALHFGLLRQLGRYEFPSLRGVHVRGVHLCSYWREYVVSGARAEESCGLTFADGRRQAGSMDVRTANLKRKTQKSTSECSFHRRVGSYWYSVYGFISAERKRMRPAPITALRPNVTQAEALREILAGRFCRLCIGE